MKSIFTVVISIFIFSIGCNNIEKELNNDVYEAFKNLIHLEPKEICQSNCDDWEVMGGNTTELTEWRGQRSLTATGFFRSGDVRGSSWTTVRLNEEDKQASLRTYMWIGNSSPVEDIYYIDFKNNSFSFRHENRYGVGFYGNESREGTKDYRINITYYPEENYVTMMAFGGGNSNWRVGASFYFKDSEKTKQAVDNFGYNVRKLNNYQDKTFLKNSSTLIRE